MSLLQPSALFLLLALPLLWFWPRRVRDLRHGLLRSALFALLAFALARPVWVHAGADPLHVLVSDGGTVQGDFDTVLRVEGSQVCAALERAALAIPDGAPGSITLVSDGFATDKGWENTLYQLRQRKLPLHVHALRAPSLGPRPVALTAEGTWRVGHTARLRVKLAGGRAPIVLRGPSGVLATSDTDLLEFEPAAAGYLRLTVEVGEFQRTRTFAVQDPLRILYRGARVEGGAGALSNLVGRGFAMTDDPDSADLVVLDDLPASAFPPDEQESLVRAVTERGIGLFVAGGKASFGPGGYHRTPLESVLPVEFEQKREKRDPSTTLVVIIDTSGSMSGTRVQLAKEVARLAIRRLLPHDKVGIVEFYGAKRWAAPIQPASNAIELQRALNRMTAGGGTIIMPAIEESYYGLQNVRTRYKHVLVLTDGGVEAGAFEPLLRKMARKGINVSTVLIGGGAHSSFLVSLSRWGKGRFYSVPNRFNLPEVILKLPSTTRLPAYRSGTHALRVRGGPGWLGNLDEVPALSGYVQLRARPRSETLLETEAGEHPVLATWRHGLGRVTALATEPTGPGTASWEKWDGYGPMLARVLARTARDEVEPYRYSLTRRGAFLHLEAKRLRPAPPPSASPFVFRQRAPDTFTATLPWPPELEARIVAGATRLVSDAFGDVAPEQMVDEPLDLTALDSPDAGSAPVALTRLRPALLLLALLVFLGELLYRRWPR